MAKLNLHTKKFADRARLLQVLGIINDYQAEYRFPPSIRDIGDRILPDDDEKTVSTSVVNYWLDVLEYEGLIEPREKGIPRCVVVSKAGHKFLKEGSAK